MTPKQLLDAGKVTDAIAALGAHLRQKPNDAAQRTFLFELLCFAGQYDRAEKHLALLAQGNADTELGAVLYYSALHAERLRHEQFSQGTFSKPPSQIEIAGTIDGRPFSMITDADPDMGPRLEAYAAGACLWIPFEHISAIEIEPPRRLRDTMWTPALVRTGPSFGEKELGEVLIPAIYPFSWKHPDEAVWLGRETDWGTDDQDREVPSGQRMLRVDGEDVPFLEVRSIQFTAAEAAGA